MIVPKKRNTEFPTLSSTPHMRDECNLWISDHAELPPAIGRSSAEVWIAKPTPSELLQRRLLKLIRKRIKQSPPPQVERVRFPVGLFFTRGGTASIRDEIAEGFRYWSEHSGDHFDVFFPGWYFRNGKLRFDQNRFIKYRGEIEARSKWRYSGETDILILNFDYYLQTHEARFDFEEVITLRVEDMIRERRIGSLPVLLSHIQNAAAENPKRGEHSVVWQMSDGIGFLRGRQSLWEALKKFVLKDFAQVYDDVRPFGVFDLRRPTPR